MRYAIVATVSDDVLSARAAKAGLAQTCDPAASKNLSVAGAKRPQFVVSGATIANARVKNHGDG
jgi:hypothetical protein